MTAVGAGGGETIPPDGAVLMATGAAAAKLQAEAPVGTQLTTRLILQPAWNGVARRARRRARARPERQAGLPLARGLHATTRSPTAPARRRRPARGRADHPRRRRRRPARLQRRPDELRARADAAAARRGHRCRPRARAAPSRPPSTASCSTGRATAGEPAVKEALLVQYFGVYAPRSPLPLLNGDPGAHRRAAAATSSSVRRPSTAQLDRPGRRRARARERRSRTRRATYPFTFARRTTLEGTWHWDVQATDDLGRASTIDQHVPLRHDADRAHGAVASRAGSAVVRFDARRARRRCACASRRRTACVVRDAAAGDAARPGHAGSSGTDGCRRARAPTAAATSPTSSSRARSARPTSRCQFGFSR